MVGNYCMQLHGLPETSRATATGKVTFVIFGSGNGLSPLRHQAIIQTNDILFSWSKIQNTKQNCSNFHSLILFEIYYRGEYRTQSGHLVQALMG